MTDTVWAYPSKVQGVFLPSVLPWRELLVYRRPPPPTVFRRYAFIHRCTERDNAKRRFSAKQRDHISSLPGPTVSCPFSTFSNSICRLAISSSSLTCPPAVMPYLSPLLPTPLSWWSSVEDYTEKQKKFVANLIRHRKRELVSSLTCLFPRRKTRQNNDRKTVKR